MNHQVSKELVMPSPNRRLLWYGLVFVLWDIYFYLSLMSPLGQNTFGLTEEVITLLRFSVALPYLITWFLGVYAIIRMHAYARAIDGSPESTGFRNITTGLVVLLAGLVLATFVSGIRSYIGPDAAARPALSIITNYLYVLPYLAAFGYFLSGAIRLIGRWEFYNPRRKAFIYGIPLALLTYVWLDLIFSNPHRAVGAGNIPATYYMRDSLIIMTIVLPTLITWILAILAIIRLRIHLLRTKGIIYRRALRSLVAGLWWVITGSAFLQAILSLGTSRLVGIGIGGVLLIIYFFLFIQALGFFYIARGAKRLTEIEVA